MKNFLEMPMVRALLVVLVVVEMAEVIPNQIIVLSKILDLDHWQWNGLFLMVEIPCPFFTFV